MLRSHLSHFNYSQNIKANYALFNMLFAAKLLHLASQYKGKKVKYQLWNNIGLSVIFYWDFIGKLFTIPTLGK